MIIWVKITFLRYFYGLESSKELKIYVFRLQLEKKMLSKAIRGTIHQNTLSVATSINNKCNISHRTEHTFLTIFPS